MSNILKNPEIFNNSFDLYNFDPNTLIAMSFNFDILKYVIMDLINSQKNINDEILQLKTELLEHKKHSKEVESSLIEMKLSSDVSPEIKQKLEENKNNIDTKLSKIEKEINIMKAKENNNSKINNKSNYLEKEKENSENEINKTPHKEEKILENTKNEEFSNKKDINSLNENKERITNFQSMNNIIEDKKNIDIKEKEIKIEINKYSNQIAQNNEIKNDDLFRQIKIVIEEMKNLKSKQLYLEKDFIEFKNSIEENISNKIENLLPNVETKIENVRKLINENISKNENDINNFQKELNKITSEINKDISELNSKENQNSIDLEDIKTSNTSLITKINTISEALNLFTKLSDFRQYKNDTLEIINGDKKEININMALIQKSLNILKGQFFDYINDQTDHNNIEILLKKFENIQNSIYKLQEFEKEMEEKEKRRLIIDPSKYVKNEIFNDFVANNQKIYDSNKKEVNEMRVNLDDLKNKESVTKATLKDLKSLEDSVLSKMENLKQLISEKFVDKTTLNKNTKIIEMQTKQLIEENKKSEKMDSWILAKRPVGGHLCASCEAYLGDLNQSSNTKFIAWNKYPQKEPSEKVFKISGGISRILQIVKNKNLNNSINNSYNNGININNDRYNTSDKNEDNGVKSPKTRNSIKNININILSNRNNKYIKHEQEEENNLPKISMTIRKNNSALNVYNSDSNNKGVNTINNLKKNSNSPKIYNQNIKKDFYLNNEKKIELMDDDNNNMKGPKITKVLKKH